MNFFRIEMLLLIWTIPLLFVVFAFGMKKRRKIFSGFSSARGLSAIASEIDVKRRWIKAVLALGALFFMALALAGPRYGYKWQEIERKGIDIIIAIDCSKSMLASDIRPTRFDRAKHEVFDLLSLLKGDRVGLVAFAGTAFLQCPLTLDYEALHLFLNALSPDFLPVGGTDIPGAILVSLSGFNRKDYSEKAIFLITDGESTDGDPVRAAKKAKADGVKLFCIGVGKDDGVPVPDNKGGFKKDKSGNIVITRLDEDTLKKMALLTGATYVRSVAGDMDLDTIYNREIRERMDDTTLSSGRKQIWEDRYQWFLALALVALVVELFLPSTKKASLMAILLPILVFNYSQAWAGGMYRSMQKGCEAYKNQDYDLALKFFIDAQLEEPDRPEIFYNIGNAYYKIHDFNSAYENYKQVLNSKNTLLKQKTLYNLGNSNFRMGRLEDAISNYKEALKIDANDRETIQNLEFVKKIMDKKRKEQQNSHNQGKEKSQDQGKTVSEGWKDNSGTSQETSNISQKENKTATKPSPEYGKSIDRKPDISRREALAQDKANSTDEQSKRPAGDRFTANHSQKKQAERMLNRLQDMPGKAMMPVYQKRMLEKDW